LFQAIFDIIYPVRCPVCGDIVIPKGTKICSHCEKKLQLITQPRCKKCSKPIEDDQKEYCSDCERKNYHFDHGYSLWVYDSIMKKSISDFKYHHKKEYANYYIEKIVEGYKDNISRLAPDALVPVPIHISKYRERGYNQAEILAYGISKELDLPVISNLLVRNKKTLPQKQLSDKERLKNLKEAFILNDKVLDDYPKELKRVLLVDDIYTTGSTIEACANVLIKNGIENIYFITLCIGKGF
jgi:ComF family protein